MAHPLSKVNVKGPGALDEIAKEINLKINENRMIIVIENTTLSHIRFEQVILCRHHKGQQRKEKDRRTNNSRK